MPPDEKRREELAELARLADGSLSPERRARLERQVAASPRLQALLREQQDALSAVTGLHDPAPPHLRELVASTLERDRAGRPRGLGPRVLAGAALAVAAILLLAMVVLPGSEPTAPTLAQAAAIAIRPPTAGELSPDRIWGLQYPDLRHEHGWSDAGSRTDRLGPRDARTVYYEKNGRRIVYTILSAGSVDVPHGTRTWRIEGRAWYGLEQQGRTVVAWERKGHMCVVSSTGLSRRRLVDLITR